MGSRTSGSGPVARPCPVFRSFNHSGADGIKDNVAADLKKMAVLLDEDSFESSLEEVADPPVTIIECLGIYAVELPHTEREIAIRGFDEEVIMVVHETVDVAKPIITLIDMGEGLEECLPIRVVFEYRFLFVTAGGDVIDCSGVFYAEGAGHEANVS